MTTDLDRSALQIAKWTSTCSWSGSHNCNNPGSDILPKRLICFERKSNSTHLISVNPLRRYKYIALSYCWGQNHNEHFKTTPSNLRQMEREIPHDSLPRTLRDVFHLVRQLKYRYLWIDALCIVQDAQAADSEWKTEAAKMGDVYANADLVIAAMASSSVNDGLVIEKCEELSSSEFHHIMRTCRTMTQSEWGYKIKAHYPLLCRGWAFQERLLARRIVHFTVVELIWECMGDRWCECGHDGKEGLTGKINNLNSALKECRMDASIAKKTLMWRECVKSFSKRDLSFADDRLFAIDGIASFIRGPDSRAYQELYFHGLWKDALPWDLLWYCDQTSQFAREKPRGPSYSWSSVDCGIEWMTCKHLKPEQRFSMAISTGTCFEFERKEKDMVVAKCEVVEREGETTALRVEAKMTEVSIGRHEASPEKTGATIMERCIWTRWIQRLWKCSWTLPMWHYWSMGKFGQNVPDQKSPWFVKAKGPTCNGTLPFIPDIQFEDGEPNKVGACYYLEVASSSCHNAGLIVRPTVCQISPTSSEISYERVGLAGDISCEAVVENGEWKWTADAKCSEFFLI